MTIPIIKKVASLLLFCFGVCLIFAGCGSRESGSVLSQTQYIERLRAEGFLAPDDTVRMFTPEQYADCMRQEGFLGPDSLMTPEMRQRGMALLDLLLDNVVVRDNYWFLSCGRNAVIGRGLSAVCYDLLVYNCWSMSESVNRWVEEGRMTAEEGDFERLLDEAKRTFSEDRRRLLHPENGNPALQ